MTDICKRGEFTKDLRLLKPVHDIKFHLEQHTMKKIGELQDQLCERSFGSHKGYAESTISILNETENRVISLIKMWCKAQKYCCSIVEKKRTSSEVILSVSVWPRSLKIKTSKKPVGWGNVIFSSLVLSQIIIWSGVVIAGLTGLATLAWMLGIAGAFGFCFVRSDFKCIMLCNNHDCERHDIR